jgi:chromosome segregation ATPase
MQNHLQFFILWMVVTWSAMDSPTSALVCRALSNFPRSSSTFARHIEFHGVSIFQRHSSSSRNLRTALGSASTDDVSMLRGKLSIMQDVVKEMKKRQELSQNSTKQTEASHEKALQDLQQRIQDLEMLRDHQKESLKEMQERLRQLQIRHDQEVSNIKREMETLYQRQLEAVGNSSTQQLERAKRKYRDEVRKLQSQLRDATLEQERYALEVEQDAKNQQETIAALKDKLTLEKQVSQQDDASSAVLRDKDNQIAELSGQLQAQQANFQRQTFKHQHQIKDLQEINKGLSTELENVRKNSSEQLEIATASVEAAETRERRAIEKLVATEKQSRLRGLQMRLFAMAFDGASSEIKQLEEQNKKLMDRNKLFEERSTKCEEELREIQNKSLLRKIAAKLSRRI